MGLQRDCLFVNFTVLAVAPLVRFEDKLADGRVEDVLSLVVVGCKGHRKVEVLTHIHHVVDIVERFSFDSHHVVLFIVDQDVRFLGQIAEKD